MENRHQASILLVDDRPENLVALEAILEPLGHTLVKASSGREALKQLLIHDFALILLDVQMPEIDGFETATLIKERERSRYIPIIFVTAINTDERYIFQGYSAGAVDYLPKPFSPDILRSKVRVFVELYLKNLQLQEQAEQLRQGELREAERRQQERQQALERRHMAEIAESQARLSEFKATLDATLDSVYLIDPETLRYFYANQGALKHLGYTSDEILTLGPVDLAADMDADSYRHMLAPLIAGTHPSARYEAIHRCKDGAEVPVEVFVQYITPPGVMPRFVSIVRDITERKRTELALAQSYAREKRIAETLQGSLLLAPPAESFPGLTLATLYQAAWDEANFGGDFFDAFELEGGKVALVVGDVTGKGLAAAARTAEVKYSLRAFLRECADPARTLTRLNRVLCETTHQEDLHNSPVFDIFTCLSLAVLDPAHDHVTFSVAGAEPPLIVNASGRTELIEMGGLPLGIDPDGVFSAKQVPLHLDDVLILITDGITEARRGGEFFGHDGMVAKAQECVAGGSPSQIGQALLDSAREFAGGRLQDDACLLLAQRRPLD